MVHWPGPVHEQSGGQVSVPVALPLLLDDDDDDDDVEEEAPPEEKMPPDEKMPLDEKRPPLDDDPFDVPPSFALIVQS